MHSLTAYSVVSGLVPETAILPQSANGLCQVCLVHDWPARMHQSFYTPFIEKVGSSQSQLPATAWGPIMNSSKPAFLSFQAGAAAL